MLGTFFYCLDQCGPVEEHLGGKCFSNDVAVAMEAVDEFFCGWFLGFDKAVRQYTNISWDSMEK